MTSKHITTNTTSTITNITNIANITTNTTTPRMKPPFTMIGSSVAEVEESKHPNFPVGATIVIMAGLVNQPSPLLSLFQHLENREI